MGQADRIQERLTGGSAGSAQAAGAAALAERNKPQTFEGWMKTMEGPLKEALPASLSVERFSRMIITNYKATPALMECSMPSILGSALQAAQLGLMIGILDQAYLVPYSNFKGYDGNSKPIVVKEAQLQIGYKGYMELGYRTGKISHIDVEKVYPGDVFDWEKGSNEFIKHKPMGLEQDETIPTHYYCIVHLTNGQKKFLVRSYNQIVRHAKKHTNYYGNDGKVNVKSTWHKNFDSMALKTVIRELFKTIQLTTDVMYALSADETIKSVDDQRVSANMAEEVVDLTNHDYKVQQEEEKKAPAEKQPIMDYGIPPEPDHHVSPGF